MARLLSDRQAALAIALSTVAGVALTSALGVWQLNRAAQKVALQRTLDARGSLPELPAASLASTAVDAAAQHFRRVRLRGQWLPSATLFLDNRQMNGKPGFFVVTPFRLEGSADAVLVQRGWAPRDFTDRSHLPDVTTPAGSVELVGHIAPPPHGCTSSPARPRGRYGKISMSIHIHAKLACRSSRCP